MQRPARAKEAGLLAGDMWLRVVTSGIVLAAVTLFAQAWAIEQTSPHWQTMAFTVLALAQMAHALAVRSEREPCLSRGLRGNLPLVAAVALTVALQLSIVYVPGLNAVFHTAPLTLAELALCLALAAAVFVFVELEKWWLRRSRPPRAEASYPTTAAPRARSSRRHPKQSA